LTLGYQAPKSGGVDVVLSANVAGSYAQWPAKIVRTDSRFDSENRVLFVYAEVRDPFKQETPLAGHGGFDRPRTGGLKRWDKYWRVRYYLAYSRRCGWHENRCGRTKRISQKGERP